MRNFISQSVQNMKPSGIRRYFDIAATMDNVISLGIGEPNFVTPQHIMAKGIESETDTLSAQVYDSIRREILSGTIPPSTRSEDSEMWESFSIASTTSRLWKAVASRTARARWPLLA